MQKKVSKKNRKIGKRYRNVQKLRRLRENTGLPPEGAGDNQLRSL